jgi:hypothetical protein
VPLARDLDLLTAPTARARSHADMSRALPQQGRQEQSNACLLMPSPPQMVCVVVQVVATMASPLKVIMSPFVNLLFLDNVKLLLLCYFNCCSCGSSVLPLLLNYLNIGILALHDLRQIRLTEIAYI